MFQQSSVPTTVVQIHTPDIPQSFSNADSALAHLQEVYHNLVGLNHIPCGMAAKFPDDVGGFSVYLQFTDLNVNSHEEAAALITPVVEAMSEGMVEGEVRRAAARAIDGVTDLLGWFYCVEDEAGNHDHHDFSAAQITRAN